MKRLSKLMMLLFLYSIFMAPAGCGVQKEEQEKLVSELRDAKIELTETKSEFNQTKAELEKIKNELKSEIARCVQIEKALSEKYSSLIISFEQLSKEKQNMESKAVSARNEALYLRDKMDELIHGIRKVTEELNLVKTANKTLCDQMDALAKEKNQLQEISGQ